MEDLSSVISLKMRTVGEVVLVLMALDAFVSYAEETNGPTEDIRDMMRQILDQVPADWNCGDPDCKACNARQRIFDEIRGMNKYLEYKPTLRIVGKGGDA